MGTGLLLVLFVAGQFAQSSAGELRLTVTDPSGLPLQSHVVLVSAANQVAQTFDTDAAGSLVAKRLPFGRYRLEVARDGFATFTTLVDIQSELPLDYHVRLTLTPVQTQVTVTAGDTLLDERQSSTASRVGPETLQRRVAALPGRSVSDVVNTQPGWLLEANGILHPRGSEYQVQYIVDGLPITDNRSPAFAPEFDADDVHAMNILTSGYPAEYGRKLGGVVEIVTATTAREGLHGSVTGSTGSFGTATGSALAQYARGPSLLGVSGDLTRTDRYLDPPVEQNFTNHGTGSNVAVDFEHDFSNSSRFGVIARHGGTRFQVPNEMLQQDAGQIQERTTSETAAQLSYQHIFSGTVVGDVRGLMRGVTATLSSNAFATPIAATQDRGLREGYVKGTLTVRLGHHEIKSGLDAEFGRIRESFAYDIVDPSRFDPGTPLSFAFADRRNDREQALFVQDRIALGAWTINAGVRWDHYRLLVDQSAFSPRLGVAWFWPKGDLVVRAAYDRAFQTPAVENLLLASSPAVESLNDTVLRLPVMPSLGNFFEVGLSKRVFSKARVDVTHYDRRVRNFADDDLLLNTGVSFPIAFDRSAIAGTEVAFDLPRWRALSGSFGYSYMVGTGWLPVTGGLLLGTTAGSNQTSTDRFPISQDQRHTVRGRVGYDVSSRLWTAISASYGSGLPVEFDGDRATAVAQYGERIVDRVNFEQGRVRASASLDASLGVLLLKQDHRRVRVQADGRNLTNRLNVVNFAGLFSGTALGPPRSFAVRAEVEF